MSRGSSMLSRIVSALEEAGGPLHVDEICLRIDSPRNSVATVISSAITAARRDPLGCPPMARRLKWVSKGRYGLVAELPRDLGLTWNEAITRVLKESGLPRHYQEITEEIVSRNLAKKIGATPARTVASVLSRNQDGRFVSVERGVYSLAQEENDEVEGTGWEDGYAPSDLTASHDPDKERTEWQGEVEGDQGEEGDEGEDDEEDEGDEEDDEGGEGDEEDEEDDEGGEGDEEDEGSLPPFMLAYGRYWQRSQVKWSGTPKLWGVEHIDQAQKIDFSEQRGIYLLHRGHHTVYVGRATKEGVGRRLLVHTRDRLRARWDGFSWFGLRDVDTDGRLMALPDSIYLLSEQLIATLELLFIEAIEPPLNRKQGESPDFQILEFLQQEDPDLAKDRDFNAVMVALRGR